MTEKPRAQSATFETLAGDLYDYPAYYDLVYGSDWKAELDFLENCFKTFADVTVQHVFEPACGTGRLLYRLAGRGLQVSGLDLNQQAVNYCNQRLQKRGFSDRVVRGKMEDFQLPKPADAAFNMINSFRHLLTHEQALAHLQCMAQAIKSGGLYLLGIHLTPTTVDPTKSESWSAQRGHLCIITELHCTERNVQQRTEQFTMTYEVYTPTRQRKMQDIIFFRTYTASQFLELMREVPEWKILATFDFRYDLKQPIEVGPENEDVVYVLKRRD